MLQYSYTPEAWAALVKHPTNRRETISMVATQMGGKLLGCWFAFGDHDLVVLVEAGDPVDVAAGSMMVASSGAFTHMKTTVLLTMEEGLSAMQKAGTMTYKPPTSQGS